MNEKQVIETTKHLYVLLNRTNDEIITVSKVLQAMEFNNPPVDLVIKYNKLLQLRNHLKELLGINKLEANARNGVITQIP